MKKLAAIILIIGLLFTLSSCDSLFRKKGLLEPTDNKLRAESFADEYDWFLWNKAGFLGTDVKRSDIKKIIFKPSLSGAPGNAYDVSHKGDRSVLMWNNGGTVTIAADGAIMANEDSSWLFSDMANLTEIDLYGLNTSLATNMSEMFSGCTSLKSIDLSRFETENVTDMEGMFSDCDGLTSLNVSSFDTSSVKMAAFMFAFCDNITKLDLSNFNTGNMTNMTGMFSQCVKLEYVDLSSFDFRNVTEMDDFFFSCFHLSDINCEIVPPEGYTVKNIIKGTKIKQ